VERENLERELTVILCMSSELECQRYSIGQLASRRRDPGASQRDPQLENARGPAGELLGRGQGLLRRLQVTDQRGRVG
jgi:hypothetical protein